LVPAILIAIPISGLAGYGYSKMLNKIKGSEMLVATYTGFSVVQLFCILWVVLPVKHPEMLWPIGNGIRQTVSLESTFAYVLNDLWSFPLFGIKIPTGLLIFFFLNCLILWLFTQSKTGIALKASGDNPRFAAASGIIDDKYRIIGITLSTILGAIGMIVYCSSYGFMQLYTGPLYMAFPAVAAVLIGGASARKAKISHVIIGVFLFQGLLTVALPVANTVFSQGNLSEILRMIVQNGIILYALTKVGGDS
jgi:simple sugar transport system permease protein